MTATKTTKTKGTRKKNKATLLNDNFTQESFPKFLGSAQEGKRIEAPFFTAVRGLPFWILWDNQDEHKKIRKKLWDEEGGRYCCFNHAIGLPEKNGMRYPLFPYERKVFEALEERRENHTDKHVWIKKATGLGITEFLLRYMAWLCLRDDKIRDSGGQMCIITGPRLDLSVGLIERIKKLFVEHNDITFETKNTIVELNEVKIEAFPSDHTDDMRGIPKVEFIFMDEADFFKPGQQQNARAVSERYIPKSDPYIVMVSTPNEPDGLFQTIEQEPKDKCLYKRIFLPYTVGLGYIYTKEEIDKARESPSFEREYNLKYIGQMGNVFSIESINRAIELGLKYSKDIAEKGDIYLDTPKCCGVDAGFGSSSTGIVVTQLGRVGPEVIFEAEYNRPDVGVLVDNLLDIRTKYGVKYFFIDSANVPVIRALKRVLGEPMNYEEHLSTIQRKKLGEPFQHMDILPVSFGSEGREMLAHTKMLLDMGRVAIHPKFNKLIVALRTAVATNMLLDKERTSHDDVFDAFRMSLKYYRMPSKKV